MIFKNFLWIMQIFLYPPYHCKNKFIEQNFYNQVFIRIYDKFSKYNANFLIRPYIWILRTKNRNLIFPKFYLDFGTISQFVHKFHFDAIFPDALHSSAGGQVLPIFCALVERLQANKSINIDIAIINHIGHNCKRKRRICSAYLLSSWNIAQRRDAAVSVSRSRSARSSNSYSLPIFFSSMVSPPYIHQFDIFGCLSVCNLFLIGDAQAPTMQGRL